VSLASCSSSFFRYRKRVLERRWLSRSARIKRTGSNRSIVVQSQEKVARRSVADLVWTIVGFRGGQLGRQERKRVRIHVQMGASDHEYQKHWQAVVSIRIRRHLRRCWLDRKHASRSGIFKRVQSAVCAKRLEHRGLVVGNEAIVQANVGHIRVNDQASNPGSFWKPLLQCFDFYRRQ
jgi:hypothetical protein